MDRISLRNPLTIRSAFAFPLQTSESRREILVGAFWLLVPGVGWLLNMGHRISFVHNMIHGRSAWPAWRDYGQLLRHGCVTFCAMLFYYLPAISLWITYWQTLSVTAFVAGTLAFVLATVLIPGFMSHYCVDFDARSIFNPYRALAHVSAAGSAYWHAWIIAICALLLSLTGVIVLGVGFLITSVWFWQVAGFSFASVMTQRHSLGQRAA